MQLFSADAAVFEKKEVFFDHKKLKKPPSKVAQKNSNPLFSLLPAQPKWPKQKNSYSKMWPTVCRTGIFTRSRSSKCSGQTVE